MKSAENVTMVMTRTRQSSTRTGWASMIHETAITRRNGLFCGGLNSEQAHRLL